MKMVGVRRGRCFLRLLYGIAVCLVITAGIFLTNKSQSESGRALKDDTGCAWQGSETLQMITASNATVYNFPWPTTNDVLLVCAGLNYGPLEDLPRASVIITFHDSETISSLLHTIHSVTQRTPCILLQEIIVIDDFSKKEELGEILENYIRAVFSKQVKLFRNSENIGLIRSRLKAARLAQGDVMVFMDSHSEVQPGWLEPLLYEIKKNRTTMAQSFFDWMDKSTGVWKYKRGATKWVVYFDWRLSFGWQTISKEDDDIRNITDPIKEKTVIGTYYAIERRFFVEIGEFDDGMEFWGGENIDLAIRVWLFGGRIVTVPCSRVAHLEGGHLRNYRNNFTSVIERNYKRVVEVWFDEYKTYFYQYMPHLISVDAGNLEERMKVKARAAHNFSWYLQNVFPELGLPDRDSFAWGRLRNLQRNFCLDFNSMTTTFWCDSSTTNYHQMFYWSQKFELRQPINMLNVISTMISGEKRHVIECTEYVMFYNNDRGSKWIHWKNGPMIEEKTGLCLSATPNSSSLIMVPCDYENNQDQVWEFDHYTDQYFQTISGNRSIEIQYKQLLSKLLSLKSARSKPIAAL